MGFLFLLGMMACSAGITRLLVVVARWSVETTRDGRRRLEERRAPDPSAIPDTVPVEWVEAYRAEQGW